MVDSDSDDYELMPSSELDDLRREVMSMKKNSLTEGDKVRMLMDSMDKLTNSINKFISILDDAQKDIIDEYQESKPVEKLNQLLEQNEMIAKALIAISDNFSKKDDSGNKSILPSSASQYSNYSNQDSSSMPQQDAPMSNPRGMFLPPNNQINQPQMNPSQMQMNSPPMNQYQMSPQMQANPFQMNPQPMNQYQMNPSQMQANPFQMNPSQMQMNSPPMNQSPIFDSQTPFGPPPGMSSMDDLPPMDTVPPLDSPMPNAPKKKFLGIM